MLKNPSSINKLSMGVIQTLELDESQDFMSGLLDELNEEVAAQERGDESSISFDGELQKLKGKYDTFIHLVGNLEVTYYTHDIYTNEVMVETLSQAIKCLVITDEVKTKLHLEEEIDIEYNGEEYDLYFLEENNTFDLKRILHEYIYLNKNPYPNKKTKELE